MNNHFGNGIQAGLQAQQPISPHEISQYCPDYRRGYVCGYAWQLAESRNDRQQAAFEAGILSRRYGLDRDRVAEFFTEYGNPHTVHFFYAGYDSADD
ncbi:DUF2623 domain-containing protein [Affinibrenneria salicis]|uniref:DUF2623 domain-containing protein n=1 Tax=Affinibrenneria salicis TaxID=2590031 RepID=A0A5J5FVL7_9GAMM|nr:DUF2623 family protein [Affinibrenneria salicis]KAA8997388.1 DUF2623 domain-containing protein [Affinibrenneria salicis]